MYRGTTGQNFSYKPFGVTRVPSGNTFAGSNSQGTSVVQLFWSAPTEYLDLEACQALQSAFGQDWQSGITLCNKLLTQFVPWGNGGARALIIQCVVAEQLEAHCGDKAWPDSLRQRVQLGLLSPRKLVEMPFVIQSQVVKLAVTQAMDDDAYRVQALGALVDCCRALQGHGSFVDHSCARVLDACLRTAFDKLAPEQEFDAARERLDKGLMGQFNGALKAGDLHTAAACVVRLRTLGADDAATRCEADLNLARPPSLGGATPIAAGSTDRSELAILAAGSLQIDDQVPLKSVCDWFKSIVSVTRAHTRSDLKAAREAMSTELGQQLLDACLKDGGPARDCLMEVLIKLLNSPHCSPKTMRWAVETFLPRLDLQELLMRQWPSDGPGKAPVSGLARAIDIALKLRLTINSMEYCLSFAHIPAWSALWSLLTHLHVGEGSDEEAHQKLVAELIARERVDDPQRLTLIVGFLSSDKTSEAAKQLFESLWMKALANGLPGGELNKHFLLIRRKGEPDRLNLGRLLADDDWLSHMAATAPTGQLSLAQRKDLMRQRLALILISPPDDTLMDVVLREVKENKFLRSAPWATATVHACLDWMRTRPQTLPDGRAHQLAQMWAHVARHRADWLADMDRSYPWVREAIRIEHHPSLSADEKDRRISALLRAQID